MGTEYRLPVYRVELVREKSLKSQVRTISAPVEVASVFEKLHANTDRESLVVLCLDTKHGVRAINTVSIGDLSSAIVSPREVFKPAILANSANIILIHNHPSGDPSPSREDIQITRRIAECGRLLDIELLDHVVVADSGYVSLKERGLL